MTYCVGILLNDGLVMISDTRTNAGIDNIATFRKLHTFENPGERTIALASSGNLSITQGVLSLLNEGLPDEQNPDELVTLHNVPTMFQAAQLVGRAVREIYRHDAAALEEHNTRFDIALLLGGQIKDRRLRLFMIYAAGNFIEATQDTPFLQIGEHKYGKPILDRAVKYDADLLDALKIGLISVDSTMRSNLAVGLPLDIMVLRRDALKPELTYRVEAGDPYFEDLRNRWSEALRATHQAIPKPPYKKK
ncbi:MAG: proteasome-type protease [Rhodospirillaceae bacterium]|nr:proteasome-type protease [Rhodospirillaceae bacterium]